MEQKRARIFWSIILGGICIFLLLSFISFQPDDIPFTTSHPNASIRNFGGAVGAYLVWALLFALGWAAYVLPVLLGFWTVNRIVGKQFTHVLTKVMATLFALTSFASIMSVITVNYQVSSVSSGGVVGFFVATYLIRYCGEVGSIILLGTIFILSLLVSTEFALIPLVLRLPQTCVRFVGWISAFFQKDAAEEPTPKKPRRSARQPVEKSESAERASSRRRARSLPVDEEEPEEGSEEIAEEDTEKSPGFFSKVVIKKSKPRSAPKKAKKSLPSRIVGDYKLPSLELLCDPPQSLENLSTEDLEENSRILEETLRDFGIEIKVMEVEQGPVITRYELQPAPGVKINRIMNLGDDIALNLKAPSVHIVAPIPGKGTIGIDVPNVHAAMVYFKELLETPEFQNAKSRLSIALGKDISGSPLVADLAEMPHLLIAGTTGSGKTVCVNTLIMSLLYQASPEEVKLILVDPKMVEMSMYNGLPHLICPVVTNVKKAAGALEWAVQEMEERYQLLNKAGARNISTFNNKIKDGLTEVGEGEDAQPVSAMPYIVIIIDELADMMLTVGKEVETLIIRLAQKSRAVGIHMILATQRPSVDVITGIIKANFPARVSFRVASKIDSRTVLDMNGADKLLGKGDMLFLKPGNFKLIRAQSSLVSDKEIEDVVNFVKSQRSAEFLEELMNEQSQSADLKGKDEVEDDMFEEAAKLVITTRQASVSILQRRLRLGYARAARLIDQMEDRGIVGCYRGSKAREVLVDEWDEVSAMVRGEDAEIPEE